MATSVLLVTVATQTEPEVDVSNSHIDAIDVDDAHDMNYMAIPGVDKPIHERDSMEDLGISISGEIDQSERCSPTEASVHPYSSPLFDVPLGDGETQACEALHTDDDVIRNDVPSSDVRAKSLPEFRRNKVDLQSRLWCFTLDPAIL